MFCPETWSVFRCTKDQSFGAKLRLDGLQCREIYVVGENRPAKEVIFSENNNSCQVVPTSLEQGYFETGHNCNRTQKRF